MALLGICSNPPEVFGLLLSHCRQAKLFNIWCITASRCFFCTRNGQLNLFRNKITTCAWDVRADFSKATKCLETTLQSDETRITKACPLLVTNAK